MTLTTSKEMRESANNAKPDRSDFPIFERAASHDGCFIVSLRAS
jgi:hypothetical protein